MIEFSGFENTHIVSLISFTGVSSEWSGFRIQFLGRKLKSRPFFEVTFIRGRGGAGRGLGRYLFVKGKMSIDNRRTGKRTKMGQSIGPSS